ncbi:hypothetical protein [Sphingopyxis terrae]
MLKRALSTLGHTPTGSAAAGGAVGVGTDWTCPQRPPMLARNGMEIG